VKLQLQDVPIPEGAEERAHRVAMAAYASHRPVAHRRAYWKPAIAVVAAAALAGVLTSPPGRSVIQSIREAVGIKKAQRELFSLPASGRLLVESTGGAWVVDAAGSRRLLGNYREASWSPYGRFIVAARPDELVTLEPNGKVHWTLALPAVRFPRWSGTRTNTRIAYLTTPAWSLGVIAGDGTGNREANCGDGLAPVAPAWQPHSLRVLAVAAPDGGVAVYDVVDCRLIMRTPKGPLPTKLEWSADGKRLLVVGPSVLLYDLQGRVLGADHPTGGSRDLDATFLGRTETAVVVRTSGLVLRLGDGRRIFGGTGLGNVVSSPDGRWLLLTWPAADQWVFVRTDGSRVVRAYSGITRQFGGGQFPTVSGWVAK
jgi:hypothetical protein